MLGKRYELHAKFLRLCSMISVQADHRCRQGQRKHSARAFRELLLAR